MLELIFIAVVFTGLLCFGLYQFIYSMKVELDLDDSDIDKDLLDNQLPLVDTDHRSYKPERGKLYDDIH